MITSHSQHQTFALAPYLNAKPFAIGLSQQGNEVIEALPSKLLEIFQSGSVDAALLSACDVLQIEDSKIVDDLAIACSGEVYSVILAYEGDLKNISKVMLDPSSHTSNNLLKIILTEFYHLHPEFLLSENSEETTLPRLIIGDPAIAFRQKVTCSLLDLGEAWYRFTGLPFVFALWSLNKESSHQERIINQLQVAKQEGLRQREKIAAGESDPLFALHYLMKHIRYDFGEKEKAGLRLFAELLKK